MNLLVIDGNSILNRAFYGIRPLSTKDGRHTNALVGFLNIFLGSLQTTEADAVAIAFDMRQPTFRHELYGEYKAGRKEMPEELAEQFPVIKEILSALGYKVIESPGFEADDILGTLAAACKEGDMCYISTGDRDALQLVRENVHVLYATTKAGRPVTVEYDPQKVLEEYEVVPLQLIDIKALMGDSSDNIPGVAGVGQKTATKLIAEYNSLDEIYADLDVLSVSAGVRTKLEKGRDAAYLSRELGIIHTEVPIERDFSAYLPQKADTEKVRQILSDLEMYKMLERLDIQVDSADEKSQAEPVSLVFCDDYEHLTAQFKKSGRAFFITVQDSGELAYVCFFLEGKAYLCEKMNLLFPAFWKDFLVDESIKKYCNDSKLIFSYASKNAVEVRGMVLDVMLAGYLINPNVSDYSAINLAAHYGFHLPPLDTSEEVSEEIRLAAISAAVLPALSDKLFEELAENKQLSLLTDIEIPLAEVLAAMENEGFMVDAKGIENFGLSLDGQIASLHDGIIEQAGVDFNIQSPKQLGEVLFEKMELPKGKKTKTGYSTNAEVLEKLAEEHPIAGDILEYRSLTKLKSTYCGGLLKLVGDDGRIHSTFNQAETRTGRISSTEPNLQNIPVRQALGRELRRFFVAKEGCVLIDADYSQIELRVLAHIADDEVMIEAFNNNLDIHSITASQVFNMPLDMVTPLMRDRAKAVNFGIIYGIGAFSLSKDIGVSRYEADQYIRAYLEHYSGVNSYMENVIAQAKEQGFVETLFNRRRYLPELSAKNAIQRGFGERVARNMPIQGTAADIIKIAMVNVFRRLRDEKMKARLILQVHDELILEAKEEDAQLIAEMLKDEMEAAVSLKVKLLADVNVGKTWYDTKS